MGCFGLYTAGLVGECDRRYRVAYGVYAYATVLALQGQAQGLAGAGVSKCSSRRAVTVVCGVAAAADGPAAGL
jgi:hypothetical protein